MSQLNKNGDVMDLNNPPQGYVRVGNQLVKENKVAKVQRLLSLKKFNNEHMCDGNGDYDKTYIKAEGGGWIEVHHFGNDNEI